MKSDILVAALLAITLAVAPPPPFASAQEGGAAAPLRIESVDTAGHPIVSVTVSVPRPFVGTDLPPEAFHLAENGLAQDAQVARIPNEGLEVVLVLDTSGSMAGEALSAERSAALSFVEQMPEGVSIAVVGFGDEATVVSGFSADREVVRAAIGSLVAAGETALYDGLSAAAGLFDLEQSARRSLILLSDGGDTVSQSTLEEAIIAVLDGRTDFYAVALETYESDFAALDRLASATAGEVVSANDPDALAGIFDQIASGLVNQYVLTYTSQAFDTTRLFLSVSSAGALAEVVQTIELPAAPPAPEPAPAPEPIPAPLPAPTPAPEPLPVAEPQPQSLRVGLLGGGWSLYLGAALVFVALVTSILLAQASERRVHLLSRAERKMLREGRKGKLSGITDRAVLFAEVALERQGRARGLAATLERAGILVRSGEFLVLAVSAGVIAFAVGHALAGPLFGAALTAASVSAFPVVLALRAARRQAAFAEQLPDSLQLITGSVRAGYGLTQAIDAVAQEAPSPSADEFRRIVAEVNLGRDLDEALKAAAARVNSKDFEWVVEAMEINRQVGGDVAEVLERVATTIRDRNQIRRKILALSAEGRLSAIILIALPFLAAGFISISNPDYISELTGTGFGKVLLGAGGLLMVVGAAWMRRIVKLEY